MLEWGTGGNEQKLISRRRFVQAATPPLISTSATILFASCGQTRIVTTEVPIKTTVIKEVPVERIVTRTEIKEIPVERIVVKPVVIEKVVTKVVTKIVEKTIEAAPKRPAAVIRLAHDHTSGVRGRHMQWSLNQFAKTHPHIAVKFEPKNYLFRDSFGIQLAGGSQAEVALLDGGFFHHWVDKGAFVQINDHLAKKPTYNAQDYCMWPDQCTINFQNSFPIPFNEGLKGPQFGLPYQAQLNGVYYNYTLFESAGIPQPSPGNWGLEMEFLDALRRLTNRETNQYGLQSSGDMWRYWAGWGRALAYDEDLLYYDETASRMTIFDEGAEKAHDFVIDAIWKERVSNKLSDAKNLSGEFGDPFSAGKLGVASAGFAGMFLERIAGRFDWGFGLQPEGPRGEAPVHTSQQPHLITNAAEEHGTVDETIDMMVFFAGPEVQEQATIHRGFIPVNKKALSSTTMADAPPHSHADIARILTTKNNHHHWQSAHPAWWEWFEAWRSESDRSFLGEITPEEGREALTDASNQLLELQHDAWFAYKHWANTLSS